MDKWDNRRSDFGQALENFEAVLFGPPVQRKKKALPFLRPRTHPRLSLSRARAHSHFSYPFPSSRKSRSSQADNLSLRAKPNFFRRHSCFSSGILLRNLLYFCPKRSDLKLAMASFTASSIYFTFQAAEASHGRPLPCKISSNYLPSCAEGSIAGLKSGLVKQEQAHKKGFQCMAQVSPLLEFSERADSSFALPSLASSPAPSLIESGMHTHYVDDAMACFNVLQKFIFRKRCAFLMFCNLLK